MVSITLCPAVHILGSQNEYSRAEGIADHYWPWALFWCLNPSGWQQTSLPSSSSAPNNFSARREPFIVIVSHCFKIPRFNDLTMVIIRVYCANMTSFKEEVGMISIIHGCHSIKFNFTVSYISKFAIPVILPTNSIGNLFSINYTGNNILNNHENMRKN